MVTRAMPFPALQASWYWNCIRQGRHDMWWRAHERVAPGVSDGCRDLLNRIFVLDPEARLTLEQVLAHPWVSAGPVPDFPVLLDAMTARHRIVAALQAKLEEHGSEVFAPTAMAGNGTGLVPGRPPPPVTVRLAVDSNPTLLMLFHRIMSAEPKSPTAAAARAA